MGTPFLSWKLKHFCPQAVAKTAKFKPTVKYTGKFLWKFLLCNSWVSKLMSGEVVLRRDFSEQWSSPSPSHSGSKSKTEKTKCLLSWPKSMWSRNKCNGHQVTQSLFLRHSWTCLYHCWFSVGLECCLTSPGTNRAFPESTHDLRIYLVHFSWSQAINQWLCQPLYWPKSKTLSPSFRTCLPSRWKKIDRFNIPKPLQSMFWLRAYGDWYSNR